jgi:hypothetical protein
MPCVLLKHLQHCCTVQGQQDICLCRGRALLLEQQSSLLTSDLLLPLNEHGQEGHFVVSVYLTILFLLLVPGGRAGRAGVSAPATGAIA